MNRAKTILWLKKWSTLYNVSYDDSIAPYLGRKALGLKELADIYQWKYRGLWPSQKIRTLESSVTDRQVREWTRRALACPDDLGALCIAGLLPGAGPGGASAVLMAANPVRFTVMDARAIQSLAYLEKWSTTDQGTQASYWHWIDYLVQCRRLAYLSDMSLRAVDRALYKANGMP